MNGKDIYDKQIAPLVEQIDSIALEHGFSYVAAFQYDDLHIAASCLLKDSTERHVKEAWEIIDQAAIWDTESIR